LKPELQKLEEYILKRYTIKDLLKWKSIKIINT
jgi:hypothetical protein